MDRVFVVDDEDAVREVLARHLQGEGYEVESFEGPEPAIERAREAAPAVIVSDLKMPGMDGIRFLHAIRKEHGRDIPAFIIVTAYGDLGTAREAIRDGAYEYLLKPCERADLAHAVARAAERVRLVRARAALTRLIAEDVRVPLGAVRLNLEALEAGAAGPLAPEQLELVALTRDACERLHRLAQNLGDVELLERGERWHRRDAVDVVEAVRAAAARSEPWLVRSGAGAAVVTGPSGAAVVGDGELVGRIAENLLGAVARHGRAPRVSIVEEAGTNGDAVGWVRLEFGPLAAQAEAAGAGDAPGEAALELQFTAAATALLGGRFAIEADGAGAARAVVRLPAARQAAAAELAP